MATSTNPTGNSRHTPAEKLAILELVDAHGRAAYRHRQDDTPRVAPGGKVALYLSLGVSTGVVTKWRKLRDTGELKAPRTEIAEAKRRLKPE